MENRKSGDWPRPTEAETRQSIFHVEGATEFSLAEQFYWVAEETGDLIDELKLSLEKGSLTTSEIGDISTKVRRMILGKACDILKLSERARQHGIDHQFYGLEDDDKS